MTNQAIIGLGSNIAPEYHIHLAIQVIQKQTKLIRCSEIIVTKPLGYTQQPDFTNTVLLIETRLTFGQLKSSLKSFEQQSGRQKTAQKHAPRTIDCDILLWNKVIVDAEVYHYKFLQKLIQQIEPQIDMMLQIPLTEQMQPHQENQHQNNPSNRKKPSAKTGILLINLGTPTHPTPTAVFRYLRQFLSDPFVIELPRLLWLPVLYGIILPGRSSKVAKKYQQIWQPEGSPLLVNSQKQLKKLKQLLLPNNTEDMPAHPMYHVALAMTYSTPSIQQAMQHFRQNNIRKIIALPLYPQYSYNTHAGIMHQIYRLAESWRWLPEIRIILDYHDHPAYIHACSQKIRQYQHNHGNADKLIFSFHGLPEKAIRKGDPYQQQCYRTAHLIAAELNLTPETWLVTFQSRFGPAAWLTPYTDISLKSLAASGTRTIQMFCPGFSADCLETLEENAEENKNIFLENGGQKFAYIPALNDDDLHIEAICEIVRKHTT